MAPSHLKEASVGIKTARVEDGILPLVEAGYLCFQILVDALKKQSETGVNARGVARNKLWAPFTARVPPEPTGLWRMVLTEESGTP